MLRQSIQGPNFSEIVSGAEREIAGFLTAAMGDTTADVKEAFQDQVRAAGLGDRLANAVRGVTYPNRAGRNSLEPTGWIYAQPSRDGRGAAAIIDSYARGAMIVPRAGRRCLAIPSDDCPRNRQGDAMTPTQVEDRYGRRLIFIEASDKGFRTPSRRTGSIGYLVIKNLVVRKSSGRFRNATVREKEGRTRNPRPVQSVIMFTLVRAVRKPQRLDLAAPVAIAEARFEANLNARWR